MKPIRLSAFAAFLLGWFATPALAQDFKPPPGVPVEPAALKLIAAKKENLAKLIKMLRGQGLRDPGLADVEVYYQALSRILTHGEFFTKESVDWTLDVADRGALRARFLSGGEMPWANFRGVSVARGYRSRIDGSVQPYAYTLPKNYGNDVNHKWPVEVWLHGRDKTLTEVKFLKNHSGDKEVSLDHIRIDIFGRGNNAYRWAGETDVFEAIDHFLTAERASGRDRLVDQSKIVLRGFSMGGAGAWHLGLHWPDRWCAVNPGAGFTTTKGYTKLADKMPAYQEACLRIYDAIDYAENAHHVPIFAYSGAKDPQKLAADLIEERVKKLKIRLTHLIAPELEHTYPPEWQAKVKGLMKETIAVGRDEYPGEVRFVTYTLKYPSCFWVEVLGLDKHYEKTTVRATRTADGFQIKTENVRTLHLTLPHLAFGEQQIAIDGQKFSAVPWRHPTDAPHLYLDKREGKWRAVWPQRLVTQRAQKPQKAPNLHGPIDDAFTEPFLCVKGSGKTWHESTAEHADKNLERFEREWSKYFRGELPIKYDDAVTSEDVATKHLILFGDPSSNSFLGQVLDGLPLKWDEKNITFNGKNYASNKHVPVMIYPNPLNAGRYVVLNSGHTFHAKEFEGTNALLFPRLGDYAILFLLGGDNPLDATVADAGLFDEFWQFAK